MSNLKLGTRGSQLALYQANTTASLLKTHAGIDCEIVVIKTSGDRLAEVPLSEIGGKRLFVKEIEDSLLAGDIDLAVHSSKDLPAVLPPRLTLGAVLPREDARDAVVLPVGRLASSVDAVKALLGPAPRIGTSSVRRVAQLSRVFPGAQFAPIRGNLDTRLRKLDAGENAALVLAAAGLRRLGFQSRISFTLPATLCVPAPGQGIIAIEIRAGDEGVAARVSSITDAAAWAALTAERALVEALGGGCQTPIGALASPDGVDGLDLLATVVSLDGTRVVYGSARGTRAEAAALGAHVAGQLLNDGAGDILEEVRRGQ